jgi:hypothetical protein
MKEMEPLDFKSKDSYAAKRLDSACNQIWKSYPYVEEYMEIVFILKFYKYGMIR